MGWNAERYIGWNMDGMKNGTKMEMQMEMQNGNVEWKCRMEMQNGNAEWNVDRNVDWNTKWKIVIRFGQKIVSNGLQSAYRVKHLTQKARSVKLHSRHNFES